MSAGHQEPLDKETKLHQDNKWTSFMTMIYMTPRPPALGTVDIVKIENMAREKLKDRPGEI